MMTQKERGEILQTVRKIVAKRLFHPWWPEKQIEEKAASLGDVSADLLKVSDDEFEKKLNLWLAEFGLSHTGFFHLSGRQVPPQMAIGAELRSFADNLGYAWYVQRLAPGGAAEKAGIHLGEAIVQVNDQDLDPASEPKFQLGKTHTLVVRSKDTGINRTVVLELAKPNAKDRPPMFIPVPLADEILDGNIRVIRIATFPGAVGFDFARNLDQIIAKFKASGCDRLIIDLRGNPGGGLGSLRVMSYLVADRRATGYSLSRSGRARRLNMTTVPAIDRIPGSKPALWAMAARFGVFHRDRSLGLWTEGLGEQPFHGKIVLLVNEFTRSAAEMIAGFATKTGAGTVVGSKTPGQVLGAANFKLPGDFRLRIPVTGWYMADDEMIEGIGVAPACETSPAFADLKDGRDVQMEAAIRAVQSSEKSRAATL